MMRVFVAIEITNEAVVNSIRKFQNELEIEAKTRNLESARENLGKLI